MERDFHILKVAVNEQLKKMEENFENLFVVNVDNYKLWATYLDSFPAEENPVFRERRVYDCNCCKHFFKNIGNVVAIDKDNQLVSVWDIETGDAVFDKVAKALSEEVKKYQVTRQFKTELEVFGSNDNFDNYLEDVKWEHFMYQVPQKYLLEKGEKTSFIAEVSVKRKLLAETLEAISLSALDTIKDLIDSNVLYKGAEYKNVVDELIKLKKDYIEVPETQTYNYVWKISPNVRREISGVKNTAIGTLITNVNEGMEIEEAVKKYEAVVAPENYKRSKPIYTKAMLETAQKTITELGYLESIERRYANIDDISVNDVLFVNRNIKGKKSDDIFAALSENVTENPKKYRNVETVSSEKFLNEILPNAKEIKALVENRHKKNLMTLTTAKNKDSKSLFKWDNSFAWNYIGGIADSRMKEEVAKKGGDVTGDLRFSIMWNDDKENLSDLDAHCYESTKNRSNEIYYSDKKSRLSNGELDVDIINPDGIAVENITFPDRNRMPDGKYKFFVDYFSKRSGYLNGFKAEIEFDDEVFEYEFSGKPDQNDHVDIAEVTVKNGQFEIKELLKNNGNSVSSSKAWGLNTNQFADVKLVTKSPNYWNGEGQGHEHLFFFLDRCVSEEKPNSMFNEYLKDELYRNHRKVFEAISQFTKIEDTENQLSGIGFSMTRRNDLILKVDGRLMKIEF
jgi:hypothetical protein cdifQCD-6_20930